MKSRVARAARAAAGILMLVACSGPRSALDPAGRGAERIAELFWWMAAGAVIISVAFIGLAAYAIFLAPERHTKKRARLLIVVGGVVFPTIVLTGLLVYGLAFLPRLLAAAPEGSLKIAVTGHQWWWRFRYLPPSGDGVDLANEIRLPVGKPVEFQLESADVIHSFWIPALGGKVRAIA